VSIAGCSVNQGRFLVTRPGDIRSENADISNDKSCEKHDCLPVEGFLCSVNLRRVNRSLRNPWKGCRPMGTWKWRSCFDYRTMSVCWSELDDRAEPPLPHALHSLIWTSRHQFMTRPGLIALRDWRFVIVWRPDGAPTFCYLKVKTQKWASTRPSGRTCRAPAPHLPFRSTF